MALLDGGTAWLGGSISSIPITPSPFFTPNDSGALRGFWDPVEGVSGGFRYERGTARPRGCGRNDPRVMGLVGVAGFLPLRVWLGAV